MPWNTIRPFVPPVPLMQPPHQIPPSPFSPIIHPIGPFPIPNQTQWNAPVQPISTQPSPQSPSMATATLDALAELEGLWEGEGFNLIWRPNNIPSQDHFLQFGFTKEAIEFKVVQGIIPNRGLLQQDIGMSGLRYFQEITDIDGNTLHLEPGLWLSVPSTQNPLEPNSYVRMGSIPHGTTVLLQGVASDVVSPFDQASIKPFFVGSPQFAQSVATSNLAAPSPFRSPTPSGLTQANLDNPNLILNSVTQNQHISKSKTFSMSTASVPIAGGGLANTAFLQGAGVPNVKASLVTMTMKIQHVQCVDGDFLQLQYSQAVMLEFSGLSWPHITIATLRKQSIDLG